MKLHGFTTDISFIPWNWWRTSERQGAFFRSESDHFSVSIHGCDHTAAEFGDKNIGDLAAKAHLARTRMKAHQKRCGIHHEPIMVFPQGVFSEFCPDVLKRTGYIAAVNTEISPVGNNNDETRIRDVWDVAITRFGSFPIFTRRYPDHGLENFAFDLLLGKPCIVVAHHHFFKNNFQELLDLVENLTSLRCDLRWRPLVEVLRRACRYRLSEKGQYEYWMYSSELWIEKKVDIWGKFTVRKREHDPACIDRIEAFGQGKLKWNAGDRFIEFKANIEEGKGQLFQIIHKGQPEISMPMRGFKYELHVAARRFLSEMRDEVMYYWERLKRIPS